MKKLLNFIALVALSALMLCSCSDPSNDIVEPLPEPQPKPEQPQPAAAPPDYLVMHYAQGGGDLDEGIISNIMQVLDEGSNRKVKVTFEFKLSADLQALAELKDFDGTRRLTADDNAHLKGQFKSLTSSYPAIPRTEISKCTSQLKSEKIGDANYEMTSSEALADFIKWSKEKYPNAKHTILIISDHGGAWDLVADGQQDTRAVVFDDNRNNESLSLQDIVDGANNGGGIDMLYLDACLMSTYENLHGYAKCTKYLLASYEIAPGDGGDYREFMKLLKEAGNDEKDLEPAMKAYVDYCISANWWEGKSNYSHDIGFYDLSRLSEVTTVLKKVADTLAEKYVSDESIEPVGEVEDLLLTDKFAPYIRESLTSCLVSYVFHTISSDSIPAIIAEFMAADGIVAEGSKYETLKVIKWIRDGKTENAQLALEYYPDEWLDVEWQIASLNFRSYSLTNLLLNLSNKLAFAEAQNNPFSQLHEDLLDALRSIAYIKCTKNNFAEPFDTPYEVCSPGILLVPFNDYYDGDLNTLRGSIPTYQEAMRYYQSTAFDQAVGWSRVLQLMDVFPDAFSNPMRETYWEINPDDEE